MTMTHTVVGPPGATPNFRLRKSFHTNKLGFRGVEDKSKRFLHYTPEGRSVALALPVPHATLPMVGDAHSTGLKYVKHSPGRASATRPATLAE